MLSSAPLETLVTLQPASVEVSKMVECGGELPFVVRGTVDGRPATAHWRNGALAADREVLRRAEMIVAMGDEFHTNHGAAVQASLGGGAATLLTIMRAFSRITSVDFVFTGQTPSATPAPDRAGVDDPGPQQRANGTLSRPQPVGPSRARPSR